MNKQVSRALVVVGIVVASISLLFGVLGNGGYGMTHDYGHFGLWQNCVDIGWEICDNWNFDNTEDGFEERIKTARACLIRSHLLAVPMIATFVAILCIEARIVPLLALITSAVYSSFLLLGCLLAAAAYNMYDGLEGASPGWSLVLPCVGWVFSSLLMPLAGVLLFGGVQKQQGANLQQQQQGANQQQQHGANQQQQKGANLQQEGAA